MIKNTFYIIYSLFFFFSLSIKAQTPTSWVAKGIGGGGALFSPAINPDNVNEMYIGCDMGGLYNSTNQGTTWKLQNFTQIRGGSYSKVNFTNNPLIRYSIDYKANGINDQITPAKTIDGGINWNKLIGNPDDTEPLYALYANYDNPNQVVINQYGTIYFSNDGGNTFSLVYTGLNSGAGCKLSGAFWDGSTIYLGTNDGIIRSTNGGTNFSLWTTTGIATNEVISSFAGAKENGITRFFIMTSNVNDVYNGDMWDYYEYMKGVYSMDNASSVWVSKYSNLDYTLQYGKFIRMATNDIDTVYIAGGSSTGLPLVVKSSNAGTSWNSVFNNTNNQNIFTSWCGFSGDVNWSWAELLFGIDVCPKNSNILLVSDYGFIHKTIDGGINWHQVYTNPSNEHPENAPTPTQQTYQSAGDINQISVWQPYWINATDVWSCASDIKGTRSIDNGNSWSFNYTGHTENTSYRMVKNIANSTLYMATSSVHDLYQSTRLANAQLDAALNTGSIKYSTNNGATWQIMHDFSDIVCWVAIDSNNSNKLYASVVNSTNGNGGIWMTANANLGASSTWTKLANPPRTEGHPFNIIVLNDGKILASYSGHRNPGFTASSGVFLFDPATSTWTDKSDIGMQYWTQDIIVDYHDATQNTWYACVYDGWGVAAATGVGGLYKTTNRGTSWAKIWSNERCFSTTISPTNPNQMYITTEYAGLNYSNNINASTPTISTTNFPFRNTLRTFYNPYNTTEIWVTSFGQGMMVGDITTPLSLTSFDFSGKIINNSAQLNWETTNEQNIQQFEIEKAINVNQFKKIGFVSATNNYENNYIFKEENELNGFAYYRIKLIDYDGSISYSNSILLNNQIGKNELLIFPNPVTNTINLSFSKTKFIQEISLVTIYGISVCNYSINNDVTALPLTLPTNINNGSYFIKIKIAKQEPIYYTISINR